jgi:polysaccharide biosynthesis transport protein
MSKRDLAARSARAGTVLHPAADWVADHPPGHAQGFGFYLGLVRARLGLVLLILLMTIGSTVVFVLQADKVYQAEADLLVTPIPSNNEDFFGLGLVSESGDPTRDAETLAQLVTTTAVAARVQERIGGGTSPASLLDHVRAEPVAQSSIVAITADAETPERTAQIANAFAEEAIELRTERLHALLDTVVPKLQDQLDAVPEADVAAQEELGRKLRALETLRLLPDPTLHLETRATPPNSPVSPRPLLSIGAATIAAVILAFGIVLGAHFLDPRIESEDDLRRYRIPILARTPRERRARPFRRLPLLAHKAPLRPDELSFAGVEEFHRFATLLAVRTPDRQRTIFVTGTGPGIGKTTTSINLAAALATVSESIILVEADARRPTIAGALAIEPRVQVAEVLSGRAPVSDALVTSEALPERVEVLAGNAHDASLALVTPEGAETLMREVARRRGWLVVDGAALSYAPDSLLLAKSVASIVIVVHLHLSRVRDLEELAELMIQQGLVPAGFVILSSKSRPVYR